jgi:cytochrome c-type biogenesis protein CcmH/NrfG
MYGHTCIAIAAQYDPNNYLLWRHLGEVQLWLGDIQGARASFANAVRLRPYLKPKLDDQLRAAQKARP